MVLCHLVFNDRWRNAFNSNYFNWFLFGSREFDPRLNKYVLTLPNTASFFDCSCNVYKPNKNQLKLLILEKDEQPINVDCKDSSDEYCSQLSDFGLDGYVLRYGCQENGRCYVLMGICQKCLLQVQEGNLSFRASQIFECDCSDIFCSSLEKFGVQKTILKKSRLAKKII